MSMLLALPSAVSGIEQTSLLITAASEPPQVPTAADIRLLTYHWHKPDRAHAIRWLVVKTGLGKDAVVDARRRCLANGWLTRTGHQVTEEGLAQIPDVLLREGAHEHLAHTWATETSYGLRGLIVCLKAKGRDTFRTADIAKMLDMSTRAAAEVLRSWSEKPGLFVLKVARGTWHLHNPLVLGGDDADYAGTKADERVMSRVKRVAADMLQSKIEFLARHKRWLARTYGPPVYREKAQEQTLAAFEGFPDVAPLPAPPTIGERQRARFSAWTEAHPDPDRKLSVVDRLLAHIKVGKSSTPPPHRVTSGGVDCIGAQRQRAG